MDRWILCAISALISLIKYTKTSYSVQPMEPLKYIVNQPPAVHFFAIAFAVAMDGTLTKLAKRI